MKPLASTDSGLSRPDIPRRLDVSVGPAKRRVRRTFELRNGVLVQNVGSSKAAPLWFQKMDRNFDDDLSPREFIGSDEDFRKLDTDGDGLISSEEARQYRGALEAGGQQEAVTRANGRGSKQGRDRATAVEAYSGQS